MKIALTKSNSKFQKYIEWLEYFGVQFAIFNWEERTPVELMQNCSGLILTGGTDIYPGFYRTDETEFEGSYTPERDEYEKELLDIAFKKNIPVLGICRGCQFINVYFKGTLISDLRKENGEIHNKYPDNTVRHHDVFINKDSCLYEIVKEEKYLVTSSHHQAIEKTGEGLMITAIAEDGIKEGIEFSDKENKSFLLGIQWHPELMDNYDNPFSKNILMKFLEEAGKEIE
jgi:putative glutamine amidotransferase